MRALICFIAACAIYIFGGAFIWGIVYSMINIESTTLVDLANYQLYCYSGVAAIISILVLLFFGDGGNSIEVMTGVLFASLLIGIAMNSWEIGETMTTVMTVIYNVVNVGVMTLSLYFAFEK